MNRATAARLAEWGGNLLSLLLISTAIVLIIAVMVASLRWVLGEEERDENYRLSCRQRGGEVLEYNDPGLVGCLLPR